MNTQRPINKTSCHNRDAIMRYFARFSLALVLSACALGMYPSRLPAEEKSSMQGKPLQEKLAALLDDETLCVIHIDFTQIDTDAVLDNTRTFVDKLFDKAGLTETDRESLLAALEPSSAQAPLNWSHSKTLAKTGRAFLVDSLGVREAFLVVQAGGKSFPALVWAAIPKHEKLNVPMLKAVLNDKSFLVRETSDFCFITMLNASLAPRVNLANVGPNGAAARPEFLEAHQAVKDQPVQVLIAPPKYVKKVFRETKPTLPGAFEKIDLVSMLDCVALASHRRQPRKTGVSGCRRSGIGERRPIALSQQQRVVLAGFRGADFRVAEIQGIAPRQELARAERSARAYTQFAGRIARHARRRLSRSR